MRLTNLLRALGRDRSGSVVGMTALVLPLLIGFVAFAVDVSSWEAQKNAAQGAADFAALSAVASATAGNNATRITNDAFAVAAADGFTNGSGGVTVTVNNPPTSGSLAGSTSAYEVIISQPQPAYFSGMFGSPPTVSARSVASQGSNAACILALSTNANGAITISGATNVSACGVASNSSSSSALTITGSACLTSPSLNLVGNYSKSTNCAFNVTNIHTHATAVADPYAGVTVPSFTGCNQNNYSFSSSTGTINPGVYCNGLSVSGTGTLTMNAGIYIINTGNFSVSGGSTVIASSGVSIILTSKSGHYGTVAISGGSHYTQTAPSTGTMAGIAIYVDRNAPTSNDDVSGGSGANISGAIYMPTQNVTYSGGSSTGNNCTQLVALTFTFSGNSYVNNNCGTLPVAGLASTSSGLVE